MTDWISTLRHHRALAEQMARDIPKTLSEPGSALVVPAMESWLRDLDDGPFCVQTEIPADGRGCGLIEAARGGLGHWLTVRGGHIVRYQIIAPTTWNFSPRDAQGQPGALEQALQGAPVLPGEKSPVAVQHIVRSFDPCMVSTVH